MISIPDYIFTICLLLLCVLGVVLVLFLISLYADNKNIQAELDRANTLLGGYQADDRRAETIRVMKNA